MSSIRWIKDFYDKWRKRAASKKNASLQQREVKAIDEQLVFVKSAPLTLGVEFEFALMDQNTLKPAHQAADIISEANRPDIKEELFRHMVEVTTDAICNDVHDVEAQMSRSVRTVLDLADKRNLLVTGCGRPPTIILAECRRVDNPRYDYQQEGRKILNERFAQLGTHIHIGMESAEKCIRYHNFYMHFLPHLIALSAGSPFEDGMDTGLASIRPTIAESLPIAGMPYSFRTWQEYVLLCQAMFRAGSIRNLKDLWWDLRPSPRFGTLELRVCDQLTNLGEALAIVAFVHALGLWFDHNQSWLDEMPRPSTWRLRENKWRAMRYGLNAHLVANNLGDTYTVVDDIKTWLDRIKAQYAQMKYEPYLDTLLGMLANGNSAKRQQTVWAATGSLEEVARFNCRELQRGMPLWREVEEFKRRAEAAKEAPADAPNAP